ncbi:MAG: BON domain-containing protein [Thiobacillus sp.]
MSLMKNGNPVLKTVRAALERDPRINLHLWPLELELTDDHALVLQGEVQNIAAKKRALEVAGSTPEVNGIVDRMQIAPAERKGDGEILEILIRLLLDSGEFKSCTLRAIKKGQEVVVQSAEGADYPGGDLIVSVDDGVITLAGSLISLSHKRMAGVLAWWVPGCRDVRDRLEVEPPEQDNDGEISEALALVLELDPMISRPHQIRVGSRDKVVTLQGSVGTETEKDRAEQDAWCMFNVGTVVNQLTVSR